MMNLPIPPMTESADSKNGEDIRKYLFRLVEILNNSSGISSGSAQAQPAKPSEGSIAQLKSLVVKNAKDTGREIDEIRTSYVQKTDPYFAATEIRLGEDERVIEEHGEQISTIDGQINDISESVAESAEAISAIDEWINSVFDYVIDESADDNGWSWRKWMTGRVEAWYTSGEIGEVELTLADEGVYTDASIDNVELVLPEGLFGEAPTFCSINVIADSYAISQVSGVTDTSINYRIWRNNGGMGTMTINNIQIYCTGTWISPEPEPESDPEE